MSQLDHLPADERAVLSLLLRRGQSYGEIAVALGIDKDEVRERAHVALETIAGDAGDSLSAPARRRIGDYLLAQQSPSERLIAYDELAGSSAARSFAHALAQQLEGLSGSALPAIPGAANGGAAPTRAPDTRAPGAAAAAGGTRARRAQESRPNADPGAESAPNTPGAPGTRSRRASRAPARAASPPATGRVAATSAGRPGQRAPRPGMRRLQSSRRGGAVLLALLAAGALAALVVSLAPGGSGHASARSASAATGSTAASQVHVESHLKLSAPAGSGAEASGEALVISDAGKRILALEAKGLAPSEGQSFFYVVWLYNSPSDAYPVGKTPTVGPGGRLAAAAAPLPTNAGAYHEVIVTRETSTGSRTPGPIVLTGAFHAG